MNDLYKTIACLLFFLWGLVCLPFKLSAGDQLYTTLRSGKLKEIWIEADRRSLEHKSSIQEQVSLILGDEMDKYEGEFQMLMKKRGDEDFILLEDARAIEYTGLKEGEEEVLYLHGPLELVLGDKKLSADRINVNLSGSFFIARGDVIFEEKNKKYFAEGLFYSIEDSQAIFFDAKTNISKFRYTAGLIRKLADGDKFIAKDVSISTCRAEPPHYRLRADELDIYDNEKVLIRDAELWYGQDPVFRFPYFLKNIPEPSLKTSVYFRERAGLVIQNTYKVYDTDVKQLVLKGDFYERLGLYAGLDYSREGTYSLTDFEGSAAISNDVYYYSDVTENWSPLGPPDSQSPSINRRFRYLVGLDQRFNFGDSLRTETGLRFNWISDPYYKYDFERRKTRFDVFDIIGEAESDFPVKGSGFKWSVWYSANTDFFDLYADNSLWFEPQRNIEEEYVWLPDYYVFRRYKLQAPYVSVSYTRTLDLNNTFSFLDEASLRSSMYYNHLVYYDSYGKYSSELHGGQVSTGVSKKYQPADMVQVEPDVEVGLKAQRHINPDEDETQDDNLNTMLYARVNNDLRIGGKKLGLTMDYSLMYKLAGPDDYFAYGSFREHYLGMGSYFNSDYLDADLSTRYDLRVVYDWDRKRYEKFGFDTDRFYPLYGHVGVYPLESLTIEDRFVFDIPSFQMRLNNFSLNLARSFIYLGEKKLDVSWKLEWEHNFLNPVLDRLDSLFSVRGNIHRFLYVYFSVLSRNEEVWRYFPSYAEERGAEWLNPLVDLLKSYNFFKRKDREESNFKMKAVSAGLVHDLHDWELKVDYTGRHELSYDGTRYIWNNVFTIGLNLKEIEDVKIHTTFSGSR